MPRRPRHRKHAARRAIAVAAGALVAALAIAACGGSSNGSSSSSSSSSEATSEAATSAASESAPSTPTSGPLSKEPHVTVPSGPAPRHLEIKELIRGSGPEAKSGDRVTVNYVGVLYNGGKEFDASWKRDEPFPFTLGQGEVIPGWEEGVVGMRVGGRRELIIPASLAYGPSGRPPVIPPNAPLVFVVDLLGV